MATAALTFVNYIITSLENPVVNPSTSEGKRKLGTLEVKPDDLDAYSTILKVEAEASVRLEPVVLYIYSMYEMENPTQILLLEIYVNTTAYKSLLQTIHFKLYKEATLEMVESLKLVDMQSIDK